MNMALAKIELAKMEHLDAFKSYVDECVVDGIVLYEFILSHYERYLSKRIAYAIMLQVHCTGHHFIMQVDFLE